MCFVFPDKKPLDGIILLLIRVNNSGFTVMLWPAHLCFPFNFHTQRLHLCVLRYIQNDLSRYKIPAGEGIALIDRIVSNRNVFHRHLVSWCQYLLLTSELNSMKLSLQLSHAIAGNTQSMWASRTYLKIILGVVYIYIGPGENEISQIKTKPDLMRLCQGTNLGKATKFCCIKASRAQ